MPNPDRTALPTSVQVDGNAVRRARMALGETIVSFAPRVPMSVQYLSQIERGNRFPSPPRFKLLASALGMAGREDELMIKDVA